MVITKEIFEHFCPVALSPDYNIFTAVSVNVAQAETKAAEIVGREFFDKLSALDYSPVEPPDSNEELVCRELTRYICAAAFLESLPQLDLVLTETGFGVVSNSNVAPASSDRIERLKGQLQRIKDIAEDDIIADMRQVEGWSGSEAAMQRIQSLFWSGRQMTSFGIPSPSRSDLLKQRPDISKAEACLMELISPEFHAELCANERKAERNGLMVLCAGLARNYIVSIVKADGSECTHKRILLRFLDNYPEEFITYLSSSAFRANHPQPYENKKDDTCFFFG